MSKKRPFQGGMWFQKQIDQRTRASLVILEEQFASEHTSDTNEQLLEYLRSCSRELGHTPNIREVIGGRYIVERFGDWLIAVRRAGLPAAKKGPSPVNCEIYKREFQQQKQLFQEQRRTRRSHKDLAAAARQQERAQEKEKRAAAEEIWMTGHHTDTDWQLLDYIRQCAMELGHTPVKKEVLGSALILERFGSWATALVLAGLELPQGMKLPSKNELEAARKRLVERD